MCLPDRSGHHLPHLAGAMVKVTHFSGVITAADPPVPPARALIRRARLIRANEATGTLDIETAASMIALFDEVAEVSGAALITITHGVRAATLARRRCRLARGAFTPIDLSQCVPSSYQRSP